MKLRKYFIRILASLSVILICGCNSGSRHEAGQSARTDDTAVVEAGAVDTVCDTVCKVEAVIREERVPLFGVDTHGSSYDILKALEKKRVIKIDSICFDNEGSIEFAIIDFAGVKFGTNGSFTFCTSRHDAKAVRAIVKKISKYYGEPSTDDYDEDSPEYAYYHWNKFGIIPDEPYIRVRPVHSEEGGLTMLWQFWNVI